MFVIWVLAVVRQQRRLLLPASRVVLLVMVMGNVAAVVQLVLMQFAF